MIHIGSELRFSSHQVTWQMATHSLSLHTLIISTVNGNTLVINIVNGNTLLILRVHVISMFRFILSFYSLSWERITSHPLEISLIKLMYHLWFMYCNSKSLCLRSEGWLWQQLRLAARAHSSAAIGFPATPGTSSVSPHCEYFWTAESTVQEGNEWVGIGDGGGAHDNVIMGGRVGGYYKHSYNQFL